MHFGRWRISLFNSSELPKRHGPPCKQPLQSFARMLASSSGVRDHPWKSWVRVGATMGTERLELSTCYGSRARRKQPRCLALALALPPRKCGGSCKEPEAYAAGGFPVIQFAISCLAGLYLCSSAASWGSLRLRSSRFGALIFCPTDDSQPCATAAREAILSDLPSLPAPPLYIASLQTTTSWMLRGVDAKYTGA